MTTIFAASAEARVLQVLDEYTAALRAGRAPDRKALLAAHPDLAESLAASLRALDFVHGAGRTLGEAPEDPSDQGEPASAGRVLGDYRILRELGRGGMAVVYEAEQVSLGRHVALKVLPFAAVLDPKQLQRFRNEAQAAAQLQHPHIVPVHAVGCERGVHYYAMQYVEGRSLAVAIRELKEGSPGEGPRPPLSSHGSNREPAYVRMAAVLGVQAAEALDHAHQLGIVHRDVKPGNLLVDLAGTLWVTDFGLASTVKGVGLTMTGELLGTIRYMSPEQALAKRVPVDHRTDVYSLGATLYELLTLEPAFPGDDPHRLMQDIASREPVPPRRLNPSIPQDLETVVLKAMAKDPGARYATAQEMADDLGRYLENLPIRAKRPGLLRRAAKWGRRHRALVGAATGVLLFAVAGLATGTALLWREQEQTKTAFDRAEVNLDLALRALDEIYVDEAEGHPRIRAGLPRNLLEKGLGFYEEFARKNASSQGVAVLLAGAQYRASLIYQELGQEEQSTEALRRAISTYHEVLRLERGNSWVHNNFGNALKESGDVDGAIQEYREAIRLEPDKFNAHVNAHVNLGNTLREDKGDLEGSIQEYREAIRLDPSTAMAHYYLGNALDDKGDLEGSIYAFREAIRLEPGSSWAHNNLGCALRAKGDPEGAIQEFRKAIRLEADKFDAHFNAHFNLGTALQKRGDLEGSIQEFREAIRHKADHPGVHTNLGVALLAKGDPDGAIQEYLEAIRLEPDMAEAYTGMGLALMGKRDFGGAIDAYRAVVRLKPDDAAARYNLGTALAANGDLEGAIQAYREAIELLPDLAVAHTNLGNALWAKGDVASAIQEYGEAIRIQPALPEAHMNLGNALRAKGDLEGAIRAYREGIRLEPSTAIAHYNLAIALNDKGDVEGSIQEFREAIRLKTDYAEAHVGLGDVLFARGEVDAAIHEFLEAIRIRPDCAEANCNLGHAYVDQGRYQEALPWLRKGHEVGSSRPDWRYPSQGWVEDAERMADVERRLDRVVAGEARPTDALERVAFAELLYAKSRHADSARMYAEAFSEDATLAEDLAKGHRYNASCSASLAAARGEADAAEWRGRALEWLRADLAARRKAPSELVATLEHWKRDSDLAAVRDRLGDLPEQEREAWRGLWASVDETLASARRGSR